MSVEHSPLAVSQMEAEIASLQGHLDSLPDTDSFTARLLRRQAMERIEQLTIELKTAGDDVFALAFSGNDEAHALSTTVLSNLLSRFQRAITFAGWAHIAGPGVDGTPPAAIARALETEVAAFGQGSFVVPLSPHDEALEHETLHETLDDLLRLASASTEDGPSSEVVDSIAQVIGPQASRRFALFFSKVHEAHLEARFEWQLHPDEGVVIKPSNAKTLADWLNAVEANIDSVEIRGTLTAADANQGRFTVTDELGELHPGRAAPELLSQAVIDASYLARMRVTTFKSATTGSERTTAVLEQLVPLEGANPDA